MAALSIYTALQNQKAVSAKVSRYCCLALHGSIPVNTKHLYNICTMLDQRRRRWADIVQMLYKRFVFTGIAVIGTQSPSRHHLYTVNFHLQLLTYGIGGKTRIKNRKSYPLK